MAILLYVHEILCFWIQAVDSDEDLDETLWNPAELVPGGCGQFLESDVVLRFD